MISISNFESFCTPHKSFLPPFPMFLPSVCQKDSKKWAKNVIFNMNSNYRCFPSALLDWNMMCFTFKSSYKCNEVGESESQSFVDIITRALLHQMYVSVRKQVKNG